MPCRASERESQSAWHGVATRSHYHKTKLHRPGMQKKTTKKTAHTLLRFNKHNKTCVFYFLLSQRGKHKIHIVKMVRRHTSPNRYGSRASLAARSHSGFPWRFRCSARFVVNLCNKHRHFHRNSLNIGSAEAAYYTTTQHIENQLSSPRCTVNFPSFHRSIVCTLRACSRVVSLWDEAARRGVPFTHRILCAFQFIFMFIT